MKLYHNSLTSYNILEIVGTIFSLLFCYLVIKENIWCWLFGILASVISIILFLKATLYAEAILALYYIAIGCYGWIVWKSNKNSAIKISLWSLKINSTVIILSALVSAGLGFILSNYTNATNPYTDATITIFSFLASYKEAQKILSGWGFWILINATSSVLYFQRSLYYYAVLAVVYTFMSIWGYYRWHKQYTQQQ